MFVLLGFHWVEWLYLFQTVKQSSSAKMLQGCWHLEYYFQPYFTYAFKIYLMKNKNQLEDGLIGVSGNADDLLSAMKNRKITQLLAAKLKAGKIQHQYLCKRQGIKFNPEWRIGERGRVNPTPLQRCITGWTGVTDKPRGVPSRQ